MTQINPDRKIKIIAVYYGAICHLLFAIAGFIMFIYLFFGFSYQLLPAINGSSYALNVLLLVQFPFFHSFLLTTAGKKVLRCFNSSKFSGYLDTTVYASIASFQLIILFFFWKPSGIMLWIADGVSYYLLTVFYIIGWVGLSISSIQAGLSVQTGSLGWTSLYRGVKPKFPHMPTKGLFKIIRHPIYFSFCIILWASPYFTIDKIVVASFYTTYCFIAPLLKEKRFLIFYGNEFRDYQKKTPYFFPNVKKILRKRSSKEVS